MGGYWEQLLHLAGFTTDEQLLHLISTFIFICAIIHTLCARLILELSRYMEKRNGERKWGPHANQHIKSFSSEIVHFHGEVEIVFTLWAIPLFLAMAYLKGTTAALDYLNSRNYHEAMGVVGIMTLISSYPIFRLFDRIMSTIASWFGGTIQAWWWVLLFVSPLMGGFVTEAGAMVLTSMWLGKHLFTKEISRKLAYGTLGLLFTHISLCGMITAYSSPPALMVSREWEWGTGLMLRLYGWKVLLAMILSTSSYYLFFRKELMQLDHAPSNPCHPLSTYAKPVHSDSPLWVTLSHLLFLILALLTMQQPVLFIGLLLLFLGFHQATEEYQTPLNLRAPLMVGLFISGVVIHGGMQQWWIAPLVQHSSELQTLFLGVILGPFTDNAVLTYLVTNIPHLGFEKKYAAMAGICAAGGLTIIANAPNPAGYQILRPYFNEGIKTSGVFFAALIPMLIATLLFAIIL